MSKESVLSRWSRRKRQAKRGEPDLESANSPPTEAGAGNSSVATEPDIGAEELARLPRIEDLTAHSDLMQFLRKGNQPSLVSDAQQCAFDSSHNFSLWQSR